MQNIQLKGNGYKGRDESFVGESLVLIRYDHEKRVLAIFIRVW